MTSGPQVVAAASQAGFSGDALVTIVAIGHRESGWDERAQGDISIMDATWGPSVGVWQIRTLNAQQHTGSDRDFFALIPGGTPGQPGTGNGDLARQARAAWAISSGGTNFQPWSTFKGLPQSDRDAATQAIAGLGAGGTVGGNTGSGGASSVLGLGAGSLGDAINSALGGVLGYSGTFSEWAAMVVLRLAELVGGGLILAAGVVVFLDVVMSGRAAPGAQGAGIVSRSLRQGVKLARNAAIVAA